jgi:hypothetical protein
VGYFNMQKFVARWIATFGEVERVVLSGASAGGFGVGLNYGLLQDSFGEVPVWGLDDSGPPMAEKYLPACLQQLWRETWGLDASLPADCTECRNADGSGMTEVLKYWRRKYAGSHAALVESVHDEVIRLFFSAGNDDCANANNADPIGLFLGTLGGTYDQNEFQAGLMNIRDTYECTHQLATYYVSASGTETLHQQLFRDRFYEAVANGSDVTIADWVTDYLAGKVTHIGP